MPADELHDVLTNKTIWIFSLVIGLVLLFGAWDTESLFIAAVLAGAAIVYLAKYKTIDLLWET